MAGVGTASPFKGLLESILQDVIIAQDDLQQSVSSEQDAAAVLPALGSASAVTLDDNAAIATEQLLPDNTEFIQPSGVNSNYAARIQDIQKQVLQMNTAIGQHHCLPVCKHQPFMLAAVCHRCFSSTASTGGLGGFAAGSLKARARRPGISRCRSANQHHRVYLTSSSVINTAHHQQFIVVTAEM